VSGLGCCPDSVRGEEFGLEPVQEFGDPSDWAYFEETLQWLKDLWEG